METTQNKKTCPLQLAGFVANPNDRMNSRCDCIEHNCAWWIDMVYSTEDLKQEGRCAIKFIAEKNSEGKLVV